MGVDAQTITSVAAVVVAVASLGFSVWSARQGRALSEEIARENYQRNEGLARENHRRSGELTRQMLRLQARPILTIDIESTTSSVRVDLENHGVGVAMIVEAQFSRPSTGQRAILSSGDLAAVVFEPGEFRNGVPTRRSLEGNEHYLRPRDKFKLLEIDLDFIERSLSLEREEAKRQLASVKDRIRDCKTNIQFRDVIDPELFQLRRDRFIFN